VPAHQIYPLDVDRAFRALDRIRPHVSNWIEATEQTISLVQSNNCDFTYTYSSRVAPARSAGGPIGFSNKENILQPVLISVVANSPNKVAAMRLIDFIMRPDRQVEFAALTSDVPVVPAALDRLPPAVRASLPQLDDPGNVLFDADYWGRNVDTIERRFKEWLLT
jgi:putative spermidine/putrescine transport system substrate-binding protein